MVTETYPPEVNGVARTVGLMAEGLQKRGHFVQLVRPRQNGHDHAARGAAVRDSSAAASRSRATRSSRWASRRRAISRAPGARGGPTSCTSPPRGRSAGRRFRRRAQARHPGRDRLPHQLPCLQPALRLRLLRELGDGVPEGFHNRADCTMVPTARARPSSGGRLPRPARGRARSGSRRVPPGAPLARAAREWGADDRHRRAVREPLRAGEELPAGRRGVRGDAAGAPRRKLVLVGDGPAGERCASAIAAT